MSDYLYHLLNQDGDIEDQATDTPQETQSARGPSSSHFSIAWIAETQAEAQSMVDRILALPVSGFPRQANGFDRHLFFAHGLDQGWPTTSSGQRFDEVHWLRSASNNPLPPHLDQLGGIIHVHHLAPCKAQAYPGFRSYQWRTEQALSELWTSLYLAREMQCIPGLNWDSYSAWQPAESCIGKATVAWGATPADAIDALLAEAKQATFAATTEAILIIEGNYDLSIGDYIDMLTAFEKEIGCNAIPTGWAIPDYAGCGLKLLYFSHP